MTRFPNLTDWQILEALRLRDSGCTYQQIADDLGRSSETWRAALKRVEAA